MKRSEHIVLKGQITNDELVKYNDIIMQDNVRSIDISELSLKVSDEDDIDLVFFREDEPLLIEKLLLNKCFSQKFVIEENLVLSEDKKVLINSFDKQSIQIPASVEIIGHFAFYYNKIKSLEFPKNVRQIGDVAFYSCEEIEELFLPDNIESIGERAFYMCSIMNVRLSNRLQSIPDGCFEYNDIDEIDIPSSVKHIGSDAFHCNMIERVVLPEGVESIGWNVFTHLNEYIYFPSTMREIEKDFFYEECVDCPEDCVPYIEVNENNPWFFSKEGTLYSRENPDEPYLGYKYKGDETKGE